MDWKLDSRGTSDASDDALAAVLGAQPQADGVLFRVWAPAANRVELLIENGNAGRHILRPAGDGYFAARVAEAAPGTRYRYLLDGKGPYPDPCSRYQPEGPHGPSLVVDPARYRWHDADWAGVEMNGQVLYELHVGTFTRAGTFDAAAEQLPELTALGVTAVEVMPVPEFPGRWNWGYDGVALFAPYHGYGDHDAFKRFVDAAHGHGLAVILDVVYNHLGPDGNYLACFSPDYFSSRYKNEWGEPVNFDGANSGPVREFFIGNACYWIAEFHLDGLRLDATQSMHDAGHPHIVAEIVREARIAAGGRRIIVIAENEPQRAEHLLPVEQGGFGLDGMWNDDFHHSARVALTGRHDGYFCDYRGRAQEFVSAAKRGFLFQGQYYHWQKKPRGSPATTQAACAFISYTQNHDQVANTLYGRRLHEICSPGRYRAMTALLLLGPQTPMLFMGQEFAASQPFSFFADHQPELARQVYRGRREFLCQFSAYATAEAQAIVPDPAGETTFLRAKLDFAERDRHAWAYALHKNLLELRRCDPVIASQERECLDGAVLGERAFLLRWFSERHGDRMLIVNLGDEVELTPAPEPLLAPPAAARWEALWSSDEPRYDGPGVIHPHNDGIWRLPGECAVLLAAVRQPEHAMAAPVPGQPIAAGRRPAAPAGGGVG